MKIKVLCVGLMLYKHAMAQVDPFIYHLSTLQVREDAENIVIHATRPIHIQVLPGGHTWPRLTLDEQGSIYVGDKVIPFGGSGGPSSTSIANANERTLALPHDYRVTALEQAFQVVRRKTTCTFSSQQLGLSKDKQPLEALKDGNLVFSTSKHKLLALSTWLGADNSKTRYTIVDMDLAKCRTRRVNLGNPDLLVELGSSARGGWWVTGSIEQTLLHSKDGRHWRPFPLPAGLSSLLSAYIVDARQIWLAGSLDSGEKDPWIVYSNNGGKSWKNVTRTDPVLAQLPRGWLEGWRRLGHSVQTGKSGAGTTAK